MDKKTIRQIMKKKRLGVNHETFLQHSQKIQQHVLSHPSYLKSQMVGIYVSLPGEVDTLSLIKDMLKKHRVCVPKVEGSIMHFYEIKGLEDLKEGCFHVLEPQTNLYIEPSQIDLMIIPMLAFDSRLYRVGYGKGYYDRYLVSGFKGYKLGLAFSWQEVEFIENDQYDQQLDEIITNQK